MSIFNGNNFMKSLQEKSKPSSDTIHYISAIALRNFPDSMKKIDSLSLVSTGYVANEAFFSCESGSTKYLVTQDRFVTVSPDDKIKYSEETIALDGQRQSFKVSDYKSTLIAKDYKSGITYTQKAEELSEDSLQAMDFALSSSTQNNDQLISIALGNTSSTMFLTTRYLVQETQDAKTVKLIRCLYESRQAYIEGKQPIRILIDNNTLPRELGVQYVHGKPIPHFNGHSIKKAFNLDNGKYINASNAVSYGDNTLDSHDKMSLEEINAWIQEMGLPTDLSLKMNDSIKGKLPQENISVLGIRQSDLLRQLETPSEKEQLTQE